MRTFIILICAGVTLSACDREVALAIGSDAGVADAQGVDLASTDLAGVTACAAAGGACVGLTPTSCPNGIVGDPSTYGCGPGVGVQCCLPQSTHPLCSLGNDPLSCQGDGDCAPYSAYCAAGTCACNQQACTPGQDWTCNDNPGMQSIAGTCNSAGVCTCGVNAAKNSTTGKCVAVPCPTSAPPAGTLCTNPGQVCSYLPNTSCSCGGEDLLTWHCAL